MVMRVQSRFFTMLVLRFRQAYPQNNISENDLAEALISKLASSLRLMFDSENHEGMTPADFEQQFGDGQGFQNLLELAQSGKSVDQILHECLNDVVHLRKSPDHVRGHQLSIHTSLLALMAVELKR